MANIKIKKSTKKEKGIENKLLYYQNIVEKTIHAVRMYKLYDIIGPSDINSCVSNLETVFQMLEKIKFSVENNDYSLEEVWSNLQSINNDLSALFRSHGTKEMIDLLSICFGTEYILHIKDNFETDFFDVICKYVNPISYKVINWRPEQKSDKRKELRKNRIVEDFMIVETARTLDCFDLARTSKNFQTKVFGIKIAFQNEAERKTLIVCGLVGDIPLSCITLPFIKDKVKMLNEEKPFDDNYNAHEYERFITSLTIKELLIYNKLELYDKFIGYLNQGDLIKQKPISQVVKEFINNDLYSQRKTIILLLLRKNSPEFEYLSYLLYDLLSNDNNGTPDTTDQSLLFDSLPWQFKKYFKSAMKNTINYTKTLSNFDNKKIPLEQQICLMKANDSVKEKAMIKLKEVKAKSEDSGSKARQYLEGLLKVPFGIYKNEPILNYMKEICTNFKSLIDKLPSDINIPNSDKFTPLEIKKYSDYLNNTCIKNINKKYIKNITESLTSGKRENIISNICFINTVLKKNKIKCHKLTHSGKKSSVMKEQIKSFIKKYKNNDVLMDQISERFNIKMGITGLQLKDELSKINYKWEKVNNGINEVRTTLENAVYGHTNAKRQIERIIGQWINGEQSGYCFGFEGAPGVGKTSIAKHGLANCLKDKDGNGRPFSFIAVGGSSNGSTLVGHNYTYVGSTWGRIVDILMNSKCMNPIIFIDELDKVSRTEHGKEIIGILTHLVDTTQNDSFQDKYFNGIDLDLSKVLFIFSYNDPHLIDRILLDRIHRIKFEHLTLDDKLVITKKYILPEIFKKVGVENTIKFEDDVITFIIETYTYESGVRKLKEILFEIVSEINLCILKGEHKGNEIPIFVSIEDIRTIYLKERHEIRHKLNHKEPFIGIMNGLWANALGKGGIIPIEASWFPSTNFLELKLTGLQGDVMKESMNVAKTLAWKLTKSSVRNKLLKSFKASKMQGIHIHCPEGAVPKDGPSAGTAITIALYSLFNECKIKHDVAITGEMNLQGKVTAIGGLDLKVLGGIKAGIKTFLYPDENEKAYKKLMEKYHDKNIFDGISFHSVNCIEQVLDLVFV